MGRKSSPSIAANDVQRSGLVKAAVVAVPGLPQRRQLVNAPRAAEVKRKRLGRPESHDLASSYHDVLVAPLVLLARLASRPTNALQRRHLPERERPEGLRG